MEEQKFPQKIGTRPTALNRLMIVPILMALFLAVATGVLIWKMTEERIANGERVSIQLTGECLSDAQDVILRRCKGGGDRNPVMMNNENGMLFHIDVAIYSEC